ncbi:MAG: hypothetical protein AAF685_13230 [Cyanobacteria bacterium P01_C01_bin.89]
MNPSQETLSHKLQELDLLIGITEYDIETTLNNLRNGELDDQPCQEWGYEKLAFTFQESHENRQSAWGTHFGPRMTVPQDDGTLAEYPSIAAVSREALDYWAGRAERAKNPLMRERYAGLVWDLSMKTIQTRPPYSLSLVY